MRMRTRALSIAGAIGFALVATSAGAQDYGYAGPPEEVIVTPPPYGPSVGHLGGPIQDVAMSRAVRYDDLDLSSRWGARTLRQRIEFEARELCRQLDVMYPVSDDNSQPFNARCYDRAVSHAMYQADLAIHNARTGYTP